MPALPALALAPAQSCAHRLAAGHRFLLRLNHHCRRPHAVTVTLRAHPVCWKRLSPSSLIQSRTALDTWACPHPRLPQRSFPRATFLQGPQPARATGGHWGFQPPEMKEDPKKKTKQNKKSARRCAASRGQKQGPAGVCPKWERGPERMGGRAPAAGERRHQARQERRRFPASSTRGRETPPWQPSQQPVKPSRQPEFGGPGTGRNSETLQQLRVAVSCGVPVWDTALPGAVVQSTQLQAARPLALSLGF